MVIPMAFYLIRSERYSEIHAARTRQDQMKLLYEALDSRREKVKSDFYRILLDLEPDVVIDLGATFVDYHKDQLIQRVTMVKPIMYELFYEELYCDISINQMTSQDQMRLLYQTLEEAEDSRSVKSDFYRILLDLEPDVVRDLGDVRFVNRNKVHLIQSVTMVIPMAFYLIRSERYTEIHAARTRQDQMIRLYQALDSGGNQVKSDFYRILLDLEPDVVNDRDELIQNLTKQLEELRRQRGQAKFVDRNRVHLSQNVTTGIHIAHVLHQKHLICSETYSKIRAASTKPDQMKLLYEALNSRRVKSDFYRILLDLEPDIVRHLYSDEDEEFKLQEVRGERGEDNDTNQPSTSPGGQQKTQTPSQKSEEMEMESLPGSGKKSVPEMKHLLGSKNDDLERGGS
ncbi:uncharacterized protein [Oncorhynchus clarkii lewisi]|uniref:uncharacterized protein n=1 Tax=Oncorhynchus clarkii lewisi TaxID=490388 RepID=UPI0039B97D9C